MTSVPVASVEIPAGDGAVLAGQLWEGRRDWVILLHDYGEDLDMWADLPVRLATRGFTVLAIDLRGHGGSSGEPDVAAIGVDLDAALRYAAQSGARTVMLVAAGAAVSAAQRASASDTVVALAAIAPRHLGSTVPRPSVATLAIVPSPEEGAASDRTNAPDAAELDRYGGGFTVLAHVPARDRPAEILAGAWGAHCGEWVARFLADALTAHDQRERQIDTRSRDREAMT